jgi:hypothetical protein
MTTKMATRALYMAKATLIGIEEDRCAGRVSAEQYEIAFEAFQDFLAASAEDAEVA